LKLPFISKLKDSLAVVALVVAGGLAIVGHLRFESLREDTRERLELLPRQMMETAVDARSYVAVNHRVYMRAAGESRAAWVKRVQRIYSGEEALSSYMCTRLTGCNVPGGQIEVCTPCSSEPPSQQCIANHQADIDAFCTAFNCNNCPPAGG
jgi:hypothetical protein